MTSAACALAAACSGCLTVAPPEYDQPAQTAPYLVGTLAVPSLGTMITIDEGTLFIEFGGAVLSEDNDQKVQLALYLDYGNLNAANQPYKNRVYPFEVEPGTIADGPRKFDGLKWYLDTVPVPRGCHTVTMMASHAFDTNVCPTRVADDSSFLVWRLLNCASDDASCAAQCEEQTCTGSCPSCATLAADDAPTADP